MMQAAAAVAQQRTVGRILHQRVAEAVGRFRWFSLFHDQVGCHQCLQAAVQPLRGNREHRPEQLEREFASDHRAHLRHFLAARESVEPRHQRSVQRTGNHHRGTPSGRVIVTVGVGRAARQHGFGQLLDEQRHAVRVGDDLVAHRLGYARPAGHAVDQRIRLAPIEPTEGLHGYHRVIDPFVLHVRPRSDHQQQSHMRDLLHDAGQQFQRGVVRPVQVLDDREHRVFVGQPFELPQDRGKGSLLALLGGELRKICFRGSRQRQQVCDQRELLCRCSCRHQCRELAQFRRGIVFAFEAGGAGELADHRMQQRVLVMRRTQVAPPGVRLRAGGDFPARQRGATCRCRPRH